MIFYKENNTCGEGMIRSFLYSSFFYGIFFIKSSLLFSATYQIPIKELSLEKLNQIKDNASLEWWVQTADNLLVKYARPLVKNNLPTGTVLLKIDPTKKQLYFVKYTHQSFLNDLNKNIILKSGRKALLYSESENLLDIKNAQFNHIKISSFVPNTSLSISQKHYVPIHTSLSFSKKRTAKSLIKSLNNERWIKNIGHLNEFNRYTFSRTSFVRSENTIEDAENFIVEKFKSLGAKDIVKQEFTINSNKAYNIIAKYKGSLKENKKTILLGAHFDSISESPSSSSPGAEDNASGTSGLIEMANVLNEHPPKHDVILIAFSGEEQGLVGSEHYVKSLTNVEKENIKGVLTMDMIGYSKDDNLECLIETSKENQFIVDDLLQSAKEYTSLKTPVTFDYWGSDHVSFIKNKIPAVLVIENDYDKYPAYHKTTDKVEYIHKKQGIETLKMLVGTLAKWAY